MKKILYFNCDMGAAGDMITAALLDLIEEKEKAVDFLNHMGIPGIEYRLENGEVFGKKMTVLFDGTEEESHDHHHEHGHHHHEHGHHHHEHDHHHEHGHHHHEHHHHHHVHHALKDVTDIIESLSLDQVIKQDAIQIFQMIAEAEGQVHHKEMDQIHFHEVGTMDAIADVVAAAYLMHQIKPDQILASPVHVGSGRVQCAHGILPVPAPATAILLEDIPIYSGKISGELCTPTGAAILKYYVDKFQDMPAMAIASTGYGLGKKKFEVDNCITTYLGNLYEKESYEESLQYEEEKTVEISVNLDDMTGEEISYAQQKLFDAGALDVFTTAIGMKKNRPGTKLSCICKEADEKSMVKVFFQHTTGIGVRVIPLKRYVKERRESLLETPFGSVRYKENTFGGLVRGKIESDDLIKIAEREGISLFELKESLNK